MSDKNDARAGFDRFGLHESLVRGIRAAGFDMPRPIQDEAIPAGMAGRDVMGLAQTGTGKTAAFALPILDRLVKKPGGGPRVLVLAPTRELATQIAKEFRTLSKFTRVRVVTIYGGVSIGGQVEKLKKRPEIVVGCPGRVLDLLNQRLLHLDRVETLVLDEADHMFDMGFLPDIRKILGRLPAKRQNLLFSATMPSDIRRLADDILHDPHVVELADSTPAETIDHALIHVSQGRKRDLLEHLLAGDDMRSAIVFTRTKRRAKKLAQQLSDAGHRAIGLQGNMSQGQRDRAMNGFRTRRFDILVATDIAARGIDVSNVSHVINYDVPNTPEAYTHRIGRTGRAEVDGIACTFVTSEDGDWVRATERMIGEPIQRREVAGFGSGGFSPRRERSNGNGRGHAKWNGEKAADGRKRARRNGGNARKGSAGGKGRNRDGGSQKRRGKSGGRSGGSTFVAAEKETSRPPSRRRLSAGIGDRRRSA
jgi:ATP-dependent RNA helicase RhlE